MSALLKLAATRFVDPLTIMVIGLGQLRIHAAINGGLPQEESLFQTKN